MGIVRILCVEDQPDFHVVIRETLRDFSLEFVETLEAARTALNRQSFDLMLLDIQLPDGDGLKFYASMKSEMGRAYPLPPTLFLTASTQIEDKVLAFQMGATDYISKPIHPLELKARVVARLKERQDMAGRLLLKVGDVVIYPEEGQVFRENDGEKKEEILLSQKEFRLLLYLARNFDRILSRDQILDAVWGESTHVADRTIDTHVSHLRKKLQSQKLEIRSVPSMGYRLCEGCAGDMSE